MSHVFANVAYRLKNNEIFIRFYRFSVKKSSLQQGETMIIPGHTEPVVVKEVLYQAGQVHYLLHMIWKNVTDENEMEHHRHMMFSNGWNQLSI